LAESCKRLQDKVIIVTGAARHLGQAYSVRLAQEGAKLVISDVLDCSETSALCEAEGAEVLVLGVDVTSEEATLDMAWQAHERFGRIDGLLNNAGLMTNITGPSIMDVDPEWWDKVFAVNVKGTFLCTRAVLPYMRDQGGGKIVNIGSTTMLRPSNTVNSSMPHYVASKGAIMAFTRSIVRELGQYNINVNTLAPGGTEQEVTLEGPDAPAEESRAFGRRGVPSDLTGTVAYLFSPDADFVTGQLIAVNGGKEVS
jgi:NAD(P)-dependent dehydrogenase (short-subunit alcohol dehydrogenase family)